MIDLLRRPASQASALHPQYDEFIYYPRTDRRIHIARIITRLCFLTRTCNRRGRSVVGVSLPSTRTAAYDTKIAHAVRAGVGCRDVVLKAEKCNIAQRTTRDRERDGERGMHACASLLHIKNHSAHNPTEKRELLPA
jgi:hypothetical protein